jgi:ABC-2 type transport system permease protein
MAMLSGTFYSVTRLAPTFRMISAFNPVFYIMSGFRFGFLGQSDIGATNAAVIGGAIGLGVLNAALAGVTYALLRSGWKLRS